jgi:hypothetical protein
MGDSYWIVDKRNFEVLVIKGLPLQNENISYFPPKNAVHP